jgi:hypothetical protein
LNLTEQPALTAVGHQALSSARYDQFLSAERLRQAAARLYANEDRNGVAADTNTTTNCNCAIKEKNLLSP